MDNLTINHIQRFLADSEGLFPDLKAGAAKRMVWANPDECSRTDFSIVYLHGFSASAEEMRPLPDMIAASLGANLFFTRLTGHGRGMEAMGDATIDDWLRDVDEAIGIGKLVGKKVIVMATSTGASLATLALARKNPDSGIAAAIFLSPNYGINNRAAFLLTAPFARLIARLVLGKRRKIIPFNDQHAAYWTTEYPVNALLPMAAIVRRSLKAQVENTDIPAFFIYSSLDRVVRPDRVRHMAARWGAPHALWDVGSTGDVDNHVIAGAVFSPQTTGPVADRITDWLASVLTD